MAKDEELISMVRMGQVKDFTKDQVEDALCSGWVINDGTSEQSTEQAKKTRGRPVKG